MVVLYHHPSLTSVSAQRTIYVGYKNAFTALGHTFITYTNTDDLSSILSRQNVDIFITATHFLYRKAVDNAVVQKFRQKGLIVVSKVDYWNAPASLHNATDAPSLKDERELITLIQNNQYADLYISTVEPGDWRMDGFQKTTGTPYHCVPLAADAITLAHPVKQQRFQSDLAFIGTNSPAKRMVFKDYLYPLRDSYDMRLYGQDWTIGNRVLGLLQKGGQLLNISSLASIRKPPLQLEDEGSIYASAHINLNLHEDHQREYGGDCNERTFKIPACGGFEISDTVACLHNYFTVGKELIVARDTHEWFQLIDYYLHHPSKRRQIVLSGKARVLRDHTYHNRAEQLLGLVKRLRHDT